jgi:iron complex transport system substrate-binding protein
MKKWSLILLSIFMLVIITACGSNEKEKASGEGESADVAEKITIKHEHGEAVLNKNPEKVVVFDFGILDTLDEIGIEVVGLPQATLPSYLEKYGADTYTNVGSLKEPDFEAIHALQPDVIFISGRQAELYDQFEEIAPTVFIHLDYTNYMESFEKNMNLIADIFGKEAEIAAELEEIKAGIEEVQAKAETANQKGLILLANEGKVSAYGPSSRFGIIHDVFGFDAADDGIEVSPHGQSITFEYVMEKNPDILFVIDRNVAVGGETGAADMIENELVQKTNAYKNNKVIYLNPNNWYLSGGGLQSMKVMMEEVQTAL